MRLVVSSLLLAALSASSARAQAPFACNLLTAAEVETATGWRPGSSESKTHGTTATCTFTGDALKHEVVTLTLAKPAPKVASSAAFAERRIADGKRTPELAGRAAPIEGLGAPAIPVQIPIGSQSSFQGVIDLMTGVAFYYKLNDDKDQGKTIVRTVAWSAGLS